MAVKPGEPGGETLIFTCSGAIHCGQVANAAGILLHREGAGQLFCISAMAAEVPDMLERTRSARLRVVIDGCENCCSRKVMEKIGLPVDVHVPVTALGVEQEPSEPRLILDTKIVVEHVQSRLKGCLTA